VCGEIVGDDVDLFAGVTSNDIVQELDELDSASAPEAAARDLAEGGEWLDHAVETGYVVLFRRKGWSLCAPLRWSLS
jgi:hypothetical protein